jgi:hypothetical protein
MILSFTAPCPVFTGAPEPYTMFNKVILIGRHGRHGA